MTAAREELQRISLCEAIYRWEERQRKRLRRCSLRNCGGAYVMCGKFFAHLALKSALGALVLAAPAGDLRGEETNSNVRPPGLVNISTRLQSAAGDRSLFGGFIITGTAPKRVLIRALGPSLGLSGILPDPVLYLLDSRGNEIG